MSDGLTRSMCAHLRVKYNPIDHDNGSASDRWSCDLCGHDFWPKLWLFPAPWMRERPAEPKLPPSEKAELQVSLLNEIGLTLAELSKRVDAMDIRTEVHLQRIEGRAETVQGLLGEVHATVPLMLGSVENRIMEQRSQLLDNQTSLATRLAQIEERLEKSLNAELNIATGINESHERAMLGLTAIDVEVAKLAERLEKLKYERSTALENNVATLNKLVLSERSDRVIGKPRKAGKRKRVKR